MSALTDAIAATAPSLWFQCQETSGTGMVNSGSSSNTATLSGSYDLGLRGVEAGTYAIRLYLGGQFVTGQMDLSGFVNQSIGMFVSTDASGTASTVYPIATIGDISNRLARGPVLYAIPLSGPAARYGIRYNTTAGVQAQPGGLNTGWHWVVATFQTGSNGLKLYFDGANVANGTVSSIANPIATDPFLIRCDVPVVVQHVCWWGGILTPAQIASVSNQVPPWPPGEIINQPPDTAAGGGFTDTDRSTLTEVASDTDTLLSNWAGYTSVTLPSLQDMLNSISAKVDNVKTDTGNIVNTLFPQLATVLNDIGAQINDVQNAVRGTLKDGADSVVRTVGELLSARGEDTLLQVPVGGDPCAPIHIDIAGQRVYGIRVEVTSYPSDWKFRTPDAAWSLSDLAVVRIYHENKLIARQGIHTIVHTWSPIPKAPYPWLGPILPLQAPNTVITVDWATGVCGTLTLLDSST